MLEHHPGLLRNPEYNSLRESRAAMCAWGTAVGSENRRTEGVIWGMNTKLLSHDRIPRSNVPGLPIVFESYLRKYEIENNSVR